MTEQHNESEQLHIKGFEHLFPPKDQQEESEEPEQKVLPNAVELASQQDVMTKTLQTSAETSIDLRLIQRKLAGTITSDEYVALIASDHPEVLPDLLNAVTNGIATADNLMIRTMQEASKNSTSNKMLEYLIEQNKQRTLPDNSEKQIEQKDEYYDESVERIKAAIYKRFDEERNKTHRTAKDYVDEHDVDHSEDVIEAEYVVEEDNEHNNN